MDVMKIEIVDISLLVPNTWNYNEQSPEMLEKVKLNIKQVGFVRPIVVRVSGKKFEIINGYHRWLACKELGFETVAIVNLGKVPDPKAKMLSVVLNELRGTPNPVKLGKIIDDVYHSDTWESLANLFPYTDVEIDNYKKLAAEDIKPVKEQEPESDDVAYTLMATSDQSKTIDLALSKFEDSVSQGEKLHSICMRYCAQNA